MPIERAVPATIFIAASMSLALRSSSLAVAISRNWSLVSAATLTVCGVGEPLATPAAFLISYAGGGVDLELDQGGDLLLGRHVGSLPLTAYGCGSQAAPAMTSAQILATWLNDSSTGVSRPKIETSTFSFCPSALISEIVAGSVSNGPSVTVTDGPFDTLLLYTSPSPRDGLLTRM